MKRREQKIRAWAVVFWLFVWQAAAMLLRHIGRIAQAERLEAALAACPLTVTGGRDGSTCRAYGEWIANAV